MAEVLKDAKLCFLSCDTCKVDMSNTGFAKQIDPQKPPALLYTCPQCKNLTASQTNYPFVKELEGKDLTKPPEPPLPPEHTQAKKPIPLKPKKK